MSMFRSLLAVTLLFTAAPALADSPLSFENAWSPVAPPGRMMAGYVDIHNHSDRTIRLVGGTSPQFERVEIHTMTMDDGVMRMRRLDELAIEAGETVTLEPGGLHLMLFSPEERVTIGDVIEIELQDTDGGSHGLSAEVRERSH